jgi:hypothetical protein
MASSKSAAVFLKCAFILKGNKMQTISNVSAVASATVIATADLSAHGKSIVQQLDALSTKRQAWEVTDFKKANEGLYSLLSECLDVFHSQFVNASEEDRKSLRVSLAELLTVKGVRVLKNTNTLTMFVRFVFGSDRKRAHGYSYVLKAAISHGVEASDLSAWIVAQGGIEEVKRRMVQSEEAIKRNQDIAAAKAAVQTDMEVAEISPLATVQIAGLKGEYVLMLAKPSADGSATVIATLNEVAQTTVNVLMTKMARVRVKQQAESDQMAKEHSELLVPAGGAAANQSQIAAAA